MPNRKLGKPSDQRVAMLRNLSTALIMNGRIITTEARAKEVRPIVEKMITLAISEYKNCDTVKVTRTILDKKNQKVEQELERVVDRPSKLHARRKLMSYLYDVPEAKLDKETKPAYRARTKDRRHVAIERLFRDIAPAMDGKNGGYTHIVKMGPRRGDAAEEAIIEILMPATGKNTTK